MVLLIASVFPVVIFLYVIYKKDHEKEPFSLLLKCLFGGCLSAFLSLLLSLPMDQLCPLFPGALLTSIHQSVFTAAIPEEVVKFAILYLLVWKSKEFNQYYDGIVYAVFVSLGFALVENILYVFEGGLGVALARAVLSVPGHGLFAVLMGYYFSLARYSEMPERRNLLLKALAYPIFFHGAYDFILMYIPSTADNPLLLIFLLILFAFVVIKLWRVGIHKIKIQLNKDQLILNEENQH